MRSARLPLSSSLPPSEPVRRSLRPLHRSLSISLFALTTFPLSVGAFSRIGGGGGAAPAAEAPKLTAQASVRSVGTLGFGGPNKRLARRETLSESAGRGATSGASLMQQRQRQRSASGVWANRTRTRGRQEPQKEENIEDVDNADDMCGPKHMLITCGFPDSEEICVQEEGGEFCYRGMCVCTGLGGCANPVCSYAPEDDECTMPRCADESKCITSSGYGWSCWHPCNFDHDVEDYGEHWRAVDYIRMEGHCDGKTDTSKDAHLDAGIQLVSETLFGWDSTANAGGSARRRSMDRGAGVANSVKENGTGPGLDAIDDYSGY